MMKGYQQARSLPLNAANFSRLNDGTHHGAYEAVILNLTDRRAATGRLLGPDRQIQAPYRRIWRSGGSEGLASLPY